MSEKYVLVVREIFCLYYYLSIAYNTTNSYLSRV